MSIFERVTQDYGEQAAREALAMVDWYLNKEYPSIVGRSHEPMSVAKRMCFAEKLLDCMHETGITSEIMQKGLTVAGQAQDISDPTIYYVTSP